VIERIIEWSARNRFLVIALVLALTVFGVWSMEHTPIDAIPDLSENQVIVFADWMGRSPQEIEDQITYPLSVSLQGLAGVKAVRSTSEFNYSMINVIFEDSSDFYFARTRVLERLTTVGATLPAGVVPYMAPDATALGQIFWYTVEGDGRDLGELRSIQDWYVRYQLSSVPGVAQVASVGGMPREWQIDVDPERLRGLGVTLGDLYSAVARSNSSVGGRVLHKANAEFLVRGIGWIKDARDIEDTVVTSRDGTPIRVRDVATVQLGSEIRRSVLEKNGNEAVGGVVMMRFGENPLDVTNAIHAKLVELAPGLPQGVHVVPFYERTRLIHEAIDTVSHTLLEEMTVASLVILLVMMHVGASLVVCITLPLAVLGAFILMRLTSVSSNIMSLSGIAISIGVLVDQAIVLTDNAMHHLREKFGDGKVTGDTREFLIPAFQQVGRPIFFALLIMVISFLPVFALTGMEGKMFHPLAFTKTFALIAVALLSITLLPAVLPLVLRGRMHAEEESWLVRSVVVIYRPVLSWLMERHRGVILAFVSILGVGWVLAGHLGRVFMPPLDEGTILDMPVTVPRASVTQVADDLKARDALLRQFPEVEMVVGKAGRADTPTDPSPLDMVETTVNLRPRADWPRRHLTYADAKAETRAVLDVLVERGVVKSLLKDQVADLVNDASMSAAEAFDGAMRSRSLLREPGDKLRWELDAVAPSTYDDAAAESLVGAARGRGALAREPKDTELVDVRRSREGRFHPFLHVKTKEQLRQEMDSFIRMPGWGNIWTQPIINRIDMLATGVRTMIGVKVFGKDLDEIQRVSDDVARVLRGIDGAVDVFPDQATGEGYVEVRVDRAKAARYGINVADVNDVVEVAVGGKAITQTVEGRERYPVRVRYSRDARVDEESLRRALVAAPIAMSAGAAAPAAMSGASAAGGSGDAMDGGGGPAPATAAAVTGDAFSAPMQVPLSEVADVRVVEGPSMIKSENGMLRNYVQLNVRDRDIVGFVEEARRAVDAKVKLPAGVHLEWSGQFEHQVRARNTLRIVFPAVLLLIFVILYVTYHDFAHAGLMMMAVPGALAGGVIFQTIFGFNFSVAVWVGYIACFGMASETGIVMLVYLREALARAGGVEKIESIEKLREVVVDGAVRRLRPKLLTEGVMIIGLAPMLWATGTGAEVIRPMAAPVLGGILMADEVIDVFLPVLFYWLEKRRWRKAHPDVSSN
jgi:Cu(I)/Ag(I) efflux system membrane protein CusA/SilA